MKYIPDAYTLKARISPVLLTALPLTLTAICWRAAELTNLKTVWSLALASGGGIFLAQLGRTRGKHFEPYLFDTWSGKPTTVKLRIKGSTNPELVRHYHKNIVRIMPDVILPSVEDEKKNAQQADNVYDSVVRTLIAKTRNAKQYRLIFAENCNYGFRRNLWGLKIYGLPLSTSGTLISGGLTISALVKTRSLDGLMVTCLLANFAICLSWLFVIKPSWVKVVADAYAERLLESTDDLD